ncbi:MAG: hypothetical protein H0T55_09475, partial [Rubrobacteraceae bacterium]|nr:hypothetical protein [Rubrobacteraceae bacterium]
MDRVREAGGQPVPLRLIPTPPEYGVALAREWVADVAASSASSGAVGGLDALLLDASQPEELIGLLLAALRLNLPAVAVRRDNSVSVAFVALGVA